MPFTFNSVAGTGVKMERTPLSSMKYFLMEINIITSPGITKITAAIYFMANDLISSGLGKEY